MDAFIERYTKLLKDKSEISLNGECRLYRTKDKSGYARVKIQCPSGGTRLTYVHRLSYFLYIKDLSSLEENTDRSEYECSHLCNNKNCINPLHISWEKGSINQERKICVNLGHCREHSNKPSCLLHLRI